MTLLTPDELAARWAVKRWRVLAIARGGALPFIWFGRDAAQRVLGHTSALMTDRYISRTDDVLERAAAVLEEALA